MSNFTAQEIFPGVYHIQDCMGVCMTLLTGSREALLIDTGYGLNNVRNFIASLTPLPLRVILTHAHHDHAMGAIWFDRVYLHARDLPYYAQYTSRERRLRILQQAHEKGLAAPENYETLPVAKALPLDEWEMDLGGVSVRIFPCPGHTPGSVVIWVPEHKLLLSGDNWNPCTWAFFPESPGISVLKTQMLPILRLPFDHVLCAHQPHLFPRQTIDFFFQHLTYDALDNAPGADMGVCADTHQLFLEDGQCVVFDKSKLHRETTVPLDHPAIHKR